MSRRPTGRGPVWQMADLEARYRGLIDHLPAVLYIDGVDKDGPMVDIGPGIESLLGIDARSGSRARAPGTSRSIRRTASASWPRATRA